MKWMKWMNILEFGGPVASLEALIPKGCLPRLGCWHRLLGSDHARSVSLLACNWRCMNFSEVFVHFMNVYVVLHYPVM